MSMDKSLKRASKLARARSVLTRAERIAQLMTEDRWTAQSRAIGLPKVKVIRTVIKKVKKAAKEEAAIEGAAPAAGAAPGGAAAAKPAAGKPATGKPAAGKPAAGKAEAGKAAAKPAAKAPATKPAGKGGK